MPTEVEATVVEENVSLSDAVRPIVGETITSNAQQEKRTAKTMEIARIIHPIAVPNTVAVTTTAGMMAAAMTDVEPRKSYTARTTVIVKSTSRANTCTKNSV